MILGIVSKESYKEWLQDNQAIILEDALCYIQGIDLNSPDTENFKKTSYWIYKRSIEWAAEWDVSVLENIIDVNDIIDFHSKIFNYSPLAKIKVISPIEFTRYMYQYLSDFPKELYEAYFEITGQKLSLEHYSPVKWFYEQKSKLDIWDVKEGCCFIYHVDPMWLYKKRKSTFLPPSINAASIPEIIIMANNSIKAKQLKCLEGNPKLVRAIDMIEWAIKKGIEPHPFLIESVKEYSSHEMEDKTPLQKNEQVKLRARELDKVAVQVVAKTLKRLFPDKTIEDLMQEPDIQTTAGGKHYTPETVRKWISEAFPDGTFKPGRPPKDKTQK